MPFFLSPSKSKPKVAPEAEEGVQSKSPMRRISGKLAKKVKRQLWRLDEVLHHVTHTQHDPNAERRGGRARAQSLPASAQLFRAGVPPSPRSSRSGGTWDHKYARARSSFDRESYSTDSHGDRGQAVNVTPVAVNAPPMSAEIFPEERQSLEGLPAGVEPIISTPPQQEEAPEPEPALIDAPGPAPRLASEDEFASAVTVTVSSNHIAPPSPSLIPTAAERSQSPPPNPSSLPPSDDNERDADDAPAPRPEEYKSLAGPPAGEDPCVEPIISWPPPVEAEAPKSEPALIDAAAEEESIPTVVVSSDHTASPSPSLNPAAAEQSQSPPLSSSADELSRPSDESNREAVPAPYTYVLARIVPTPISLTPILPNMRHPFSTNLLTWWMCRNFMYDACSTSPAH